MADSENKTGQEHSGKSEVAVAGWERVNRIVKREFSGPSGVKVPLRISMDRQAYADLTAQAKASLDKEICGVLAGCVCEDSEGLFVHVNAVVQGESAKSGTAHVTFTQEAWNIIHATMEREHKKLAIVGWYHSHPGFGVAFSEMDLFIQRNFFPEPTQIAFVTDPLGGEEAVCRNTADGIEYIDRFWIDGRERRCRALEPAAQQVQENSSELAGQINKLEQRLSQMIQIVDAERARLVQFQMMLLLIVGLAVIAAIGYGVYHWISVRTSPPQVLTTVPVPVQINGQTAYLGVAVTKWVIPPGLDSAVIEYEMRRRGLEAELQKALSAALAIQAGVDGHVGAAETSGTSTRAGENSQANQAGVSNASVPAYNSSTSNTVSISEGSAKK